MNDPFITALNTQKAAYGWYQAIAQNLSNVYTPGYRETRWTFADFINGIQVTEAARNTDQGKSMPGELPTNLMIEGEGYFAVRKASGQLLFTRLGDFKFNAEGTLVNDKGYKVQGYMLGENGAVLDTLDTEGAGAPVPNNTTHSKGGPGHIPTTEINLWVDPANGKFLGKFDEYKIQSDGTVNGIAEKGKVVVPLYRVALASFTNASALNEVEDHMFAPTTISGEPLAGSGEIRSGLLEKSNVSLREQVSYLQQAKLQMDVASKLISTNKNLLEEALRLIQ